MSITAWSLIVTSLIVLGLQVFKGLTGAKDNHAHDISMAVGALGGLLTAFLAHQDTISAFVLSGGLGLFIPAGMYPVVKRYLPFVFDVLALVSKNLKGLTGGVTPGDGGTAPPASPVPPGGGAPA